MLNYKTPALALRAAEAALREMDGISGQLTIVDNDSRDGSFETLQQGAKDKGWLAQGRVAVIASPKNGGFGAGNNYAIRAGLKNGQDPDFIYIVNSDAFPEPGAICALLDHLQANPKTGLAGSAIHGSDGAPHSTAFRFPSILGEFEGAVCTSVVTRVLARHSVSQPSPQIAQTVDWVAGASLMIRAEVLDKIGLFDEAFFLYFEETELCHRARRAGWATDYVPSSTATHIGSASTGMKFWTRTPGYWFASRQYYFVKTKGRAYAALATTAHLLGGAIYRMRILIERKPRLDPPHFLRDMLAHALGLSPRSTTPPRPAPRPAKEPN